MKTGDTFMFKGLRLKAAPIKEWGDCEGCFGGNGPCGALPVCRPKPNDISAGKKFLLDTDHEPTAHYVALMRLRGEM